MIKKVKLFFLLALPVIQGFAQQSLQAYIDTATKNNPGLRAYQYQSNALQQRIKPSAAWDDPMLKVGVMNLPTNFSFSDDMMTMKQVGIEQSFSVGKKYSLKNVVAQREFEASVYNLQSQQLSLIKQVKEQYYDLYAQQRAIETTQNSIEAMRNYLNIANSRYSIGEGTQQDVLKAQLQITKMQDELIKMQSMFTDMVAAFNTLLWRDKTDTVAIPASLNYLPISLQMDSLMQLAEENNPMILATKKNNK